MTTPNLRIEDIVPEDISKSPFADIPFLFYRHQGKNERLLNRIAGHIEKMDRDSKNNLERVLNLQFITAPRDSHGNVCFADDPHLRPEYRTGFHPIDLWDYYYAMWHSRKFWRENQGQSPALQLPDQELFWKLVRLGNELRRIHSSRIRTEEYQFDLSFNDDTIIQQVSERFLPVDGSGHIGRLYLNKQDYIGSVPQRAWTFDLRGRYFLSDYMDDHTGSTLGPDQIHSLLQWIVIIDRTCRAVEEVVS